VSHDFVFVMSRVLTVPQRRALVHAIIDLVWWYSLKFLHGHSQVISSQF